MQAAKRGDARALESAVRVVSSPPVPLCLCAHPLARGRRGCGAGYAGGHAARPAKLSRRGRGQVEGWLLRIARNRVYSEARRRKPVPLPEGFDPPDPAPPPGERLERVERRARILRALDSLDAEMREMVILRYEMELSYAQIAAAMEISQTRVKWRLRDAREKLRALLEGEDV